MRGSILTASLLILLSLSSINVQAYTSPSDSIQTHCSEFYDLIDHYDYKAECVAWSAADGCGWIIWSIGVPFEIINVAPGPTPHAIQIVGGEAQNLQYELWYTCYWEDAYGEIVWEVLPTILFVGNTVEDTCNYQVDGGDLSQWTRPVIWTDGDACDPVDCYTWYGYGECWYSMPCPGLERTILANHGISEDWYACYTDDQGRILPCIQTSQGNLCSWLDDLTK